MGVLCDHTSDSAFLLGQTTVTCTASGGANDIPATAYTTLTVTVVDGALAITPGVNPNAVLATSPTSGAPVALTAPTASDLSGPVQVVCDRPPGSWFPIGLTVVHCSANKPGDNPPTAATTFTVNVYEPATVPNGPKMGTATAGNGSASVSFDPPPYDGSSPITGYTATCSPTGGGTSHSAAGPYTPLTVTGIPTASTGTVTLSSAPATLNCPGVPPAIKSVTTLTDTGIASTSSLKATVVQQAVATAPGKVCYSSTIPFKSVTHPGTPKAGTFLLLPCAATANVAPCQVSSAQTPKSLVVKFLAPGGDPRFSIVVPTGRLVWPSSFPAGKVGTSYSTSLLSSGGKAPFHWKVRSGGLPPGLNLNTSSGTITGKPTAKGTFTCSIGVTDSESTPQSAVINVSIKIT